MKQFLFAFVSAAVVFITQSGCGGSAETSATLPETPMDKIPIGKSIVVKLSPNVSLEIVKLPNGMLFGKHEVTQAQWASIMEDNLLLSPDDLYFDEDDNLVEDAPVRAVSWDYCQEFLNRLNAIPSVKELEMEFRLPTEEEWEYACRAGTKGDYCQLDDGTEITNETLGQVAWYEGNSDTRAPHSVGQKKPNAFGLYDMLGNVFEWTSCSIEYYRVARGGCYLSPPNQCKVSFSANFPSDDGPEGFGFRLCAGSGKTSIEDSKIKVVKALVESMVFIPADTVFAMGENEVTQEQWQTIMGGNPSQFSVSPIPTENVSRSQYPVENVSADRCEKFIKRLNELPLVKESGLTFRLPTVAEWEYACGGRFSVNELERGMVAWFETNSDGKTHPVGQKEPNAFGLYDMFGNVQEWTSEYYDGDRIVCGGSWRHPVKWYLPYSAVSLSTPRWPTMKWYDERTGFRLCADFNANAYAKWKANRKGREEFNRKAREEFKRKAEEEFKRKAEEALGWKSKSKRVPISDSVAIELRSVPGGLWFGTYEVTQVQWEAVMGENPSDFKGENNPVENISWVDCQAFLKKLNALTTVKASGLVFRLPTATEWEYACRTGSPGKYCLLADGTEITEGTLRQVAWFRGNSDMKTHPVGEKSPNAWGLYDMHGNVSEWTDTAGGGLRVRRGGGWYDSAGFCESSNRDGSPPSFRSGDLGFRLCASDRAD